MQPFQRKLVVSEEIKQTAPRPTHRDSARHINRVPANDGVIAAEICRGMPNASELSRTVPNIPDRLRRQDNVMCSLCFSLVNNIVPTLQMFRLASEKALTLTTYIDLGVRSG